MKNIVESVGAYLFSEDQNNIYAILDGASVPELPQILHRYQPDYECLYRGDLTPDMLYVAPYLVRLESPSEFMEMIIEQGWGKHWGIFALSPAVLRAMRQHFRKFLMVHDPDGKPVLFRYYDPRVLRVYLPTCNAEELVTVFGPVVSYILEDEDTNTALRFWEDSGALKLEKLPLAP